jgi:hypothetical protein
MLEAVLINAFKLVLEFFFFLKSDNRKGKMDKDERNHDLQAWPRWQGPERETARLAGQNQPGYNPV